MSRKIITKLKMLQAVLIGLSVILFVVSVFLDYRQQKKMIVERLRDQLPFVDLMKLESGDYAIERHQLEKFVQYFATVTKNDPRQAEAHAILGFCYYYLGEPDKAMIEYQKAVDLKPDFFGFHYDLAAVAFSQADYQKALVEFKNALATKPEDNILFFRNSKIFIYIVYKARATDISLGNRLKQGYALSAYYAAACLDKLGDQEQAALFRQKMTNAGVAVPKNVTDVRLKLF